MTTGRAHAPAALTAACAVWLLVSGFETWQLLTHYRPGSPVVAWLLVLQLAAAVGVILVWRLRSAGLWLFAVVVATTQGMLLYQGRWSFDTLLLPVLVLAVAGAHLNRMR